MASMMAIADANSFKVEGGSKATFLEAAEGSAMVEASPVRASSVRASSI